MIATDSDIIPTHACFDDALDFFALMLTERELVERHEHYRLVHGICSGSFDSDMFAHAWVEQLDLQLAWQAGKLRSTGEHVYYALPVDVFRRDFRVLRGTRYSLHQAAKLNNDTGHYGPWRDDYRALCARGDGRIVGRVTSSAPSIVVKVSPARLAMLQAIVG